MDKQKILIYPTRLLSSLVVFCTFLIASFLTVGCSEQEKGQQALAAGNAKEMTIPVEGMSCNSCVASVKRTLRPMEGVQQVAVSLEDRKATIAYDPEKVTPEQVRKAINDLGYKAGEPVANENK
jgi:copper ion binding protein